MEDGVTFLSGIGRSGTTIFYKVLSHHNNIYWLSPFADKFLNKPQYNDWLINSIDRWLPSYFRKRFEPVECYNFFNKSFKGFSKPFRDLVKDDVTSKSKKVMRGSFEKFNYSKKNHIAVKVTGWPRLGFLKETFPEAKFIHIKREGKAVVNSFLDVPFWNGWQGTEKWRWGNLSDEHLALWKKYDNSFVALAAIQYLIYMEAFELAKSKLNENDILEIKYEDFVTSPSLELKRAVEFMGLTWDKSIEKGLESFNIVDNNVKWKKDLTTSQQIIVSEIINPYLTKYGY